MSGAAAPPRARSAVLVVPADNERMLRRSTEADADAVVLDLEDAVLPSRKAPARALLAEALPALRWRAPSVCVRINGSGSGWAADDLRALAGVAGWDGVVLPKVERPEEVAAVEAALRAAGREDVELHALIESPRGLLEAAAIAASSPWVTALVLGYADLGAELGRAPEADPAQWRGMRDLLLLAARAAGVDALDGPWLGVDVDDALRRSAAEAAAAGFDGKWAIHPRQLAAVRAAFAPTAEQLAQAREIVRLLDASAADGGRGALRHEGRMIDEAVARRARRTLSRSA